MKFILRPILSEMKNLYSKPISPDRFKEYLSKLQGATKGDLSLPISGFNPMAKNHILSKIEELEKLDAERLMRTTIDEFNSTFDLVSNDSYLVVLNIADDLRGSWTNFYTADFNSKFKLSAFVNRKFCAPYFWTSELYTEEVIRSRTLEYLSRTLYRLNNPQPQTLDEHLEQEIFVASKLNQSCPEFEESTFEKMHAFYLENRNSEEYHKIFNFFYGDKGSGSLGYKQYGFTMQTGYNYATLTARKRKTNAKQ